MPLSANGLFDLKTTSELPTCTANLSDKFHRPLLKISHLTPEKHLEQHI